jgi:indolepyruvate ferredoxin oxidoreductase
LSLAPITSCWPRRTNGKSRGCSRRLIAEFEADVANLTQRLTPASHPIAVRVIESYETIRGYGHVKEANAEQAAKARASALNELKGGRAPIEKAA